jgi:hypothetical protein
VARRLEQAEAALPARLDAAEAAAATTSTTGAAATGPQAAAPLAAAAGGRCQPRGQEGSAASAAGQSLAAR